jgi:cytochrome subunit of sulfide dehydrogenase
MRTRQGLAGAVLALGLLGSAAPALAQSTVERGLLISFTCSGCHGHDFNGVGGIPLLRGRDAAELNAQMTEFRSNQRYSTVMGRLARGMTEDDIRAVSAYLANLR